LLSCPIRFRCPLDALPVDGVSLMEHGSNGSCCMGLLYSQGEVHFPPFVDELSKISRNATVLLFFRPSFSYCFSGEE
jgi:hypothetical protein